MLNFESVFYHLNSEECAEGTFCRNPSPNTHILPFCKTVDGNWRNCKITRCDSAWGKYLGNRGFDVTGGHGSLKYWTDLENIRTSDLDTFSYRASNSKIHVGKYHNGQNGYWGEMEENTKYYNAKVRTNFIAPFDGVYRFLWTVDDHLQVQSNFDLQTGSYNQFASIHKACGVFELGCADAGFVDFMYNKARLSAKNHKKDL